MSLSQPMIKIPKNLNYSSNSKMLMTLALTIEAISRKWTSPKLKST